MSRWRVAAAIAALVLLLIAATPLRPSRASAPTAPSVGAAGATALPREASSGAAPLPRASPAEQALARAYAALGAAADGDTRRLDALDAEARARLDEARRLLDDAAPAGAPRATGGVDASAGAATAPGVARESGGGGVSPSAAGGESAPAAAAVPSGPMTLDLAHAVDPARALRDGCEGPDLIAPGLWAKVPFRPDQRPRLVIADRGGAGYAIALYGGDFSTIRLDGGLVVPGRFYQVRGEAVITGAAAASVDIRPLDAVQGNVSTPVKPPSSNG